MRKLISSTFSVRTSIPGKDGENSVRLSLDNEHEDFLYSDSKELPVAPASGATSQAHLWDGKTEVSASDVTWAVDFTKSSGVPTSGTNAPTCTNGLLTVKHITSETAKVVVKATYPKTNGKDYFAEFTANRTKQDKYDLIVKPSSISYNSATYQTVTISLSAKRTDLQGNTTDVTISTSETLSAGNVYIFWAYVDGNGSIGTLENLKGTGKQVAKADAGSNMGVYFELRKYTSSSAYRLCDYETVEIAKAENGAPGKNSIRIDLGNQADLVSCDSNSKARFTRTIGTVARIYDGGTLVTSGATAASATITVIRNGESTNITSSPSYGSTGAAYSWTFLQGDVLTEVAYSVNIAVTYNGVTYNATFTLARTDMEAIYQISAYPSAISFKYDSNGDLTPASENLYIQYCKVTGTGSEVGRISNGNAIDSLLYPYYRIDGGSWYRWTDTQGGAISFNNGYMQVPSSVTWRNIEVCLSTSSSGPQDTNIIDREVIPVVKDGAAGDDAVVFTILCTDTIKPGDTEVTVNVKRSEGLTIETKTYLQANEAWGVVLNASITGGASANVSNGKVNISGTITSASVLTLELRKSNVVVDTKVIRAVADGVGEPGHVGRWYYFAGDYDNTPAHYVMESTRAPYVRIITNNTPHYYMLDNQGVEPDNHTMTAEQNPTEAGQTQWTEMQATFKYIITEAIFSGYAHLGSFIINGDWMISKCGILYYEGSISDYITEQNCDVPYSPFTFIPYTQFNPEYPNIPQPHGFNFCPTFAVDGKTGNSYQSNAFIQGTVYANSGYFKGGIYAPLLRITDDNIGQYAQYDGSRYRMKTFPNNVGGMQFETTSEIFVDLPSVDAAQNGREFEILNMSENASAFVRITATNAFGGGIVLRRYHYIKFKVIFDNELSDETYQYYKWMKIAAMNINSALATGDTEDGAHVEIGNVVTV